MADYKIVREKMIQHRDLLVRSDADGNVHVQILSTAKAIDLTEEQAIVVHMLLEDITEWVSGALSDSQLNSRTDRAEAADAR